MALSATADSYIDDDIRKKASVVNAVQQIEGSIEQLFGTLGGEYIQQDQIGQVGVS